MIGPKFVLRMRNGMEEVPFYNIRFGSKAQRRQVFNKCVREVIG